MSNQVMPWEEWRLEVARIFRERLVALGAVEPDVWVDTIDWQAWRETNYEEGHSPAEAVEEELYAMANS